MAASIEATRRNGSQRKTRKKSGKRFHLQKANGVIAHRVRDVGADKFAFVCIDPARQRSEWMMADFLGNVLLEPRTLEHRQGHFAAAVALVRRTAEQHGLRELIVTVEGTGHHHLPVQRAFARAGFEVRIVHPHGSLPGLGNQQRGNSQLSVICGRADVSGLLNQPA